MFRGDLRQLPQTSPLKAERPEREGPEPSPGIFVPPGETSAAGAEEPEGPSAPVGGPSAPAPPPTGNFEGLDFNTFGNGHPPDTVGDVGPNHYIQAINTSIGIYDKATGTRITAFSFNTFMSQGHFGNLCDTNNFGDPVILYDSFEDRWVITDFAFQLSGGSVVNPPGAYQCFAVSRTGDPVAGGWNYYSLHITDLLNDYPKFGIWPDGIYMSANMFPFPAGGAFQGPRVWALNKMQMYAGAPSVQSVSFDAPSADFTILPSNARLQTGTPPAGTPNYFLSTWEFLNAVTVYKFHVDWNHISTSTFTGPNIPIIPITATAWPNQSVANAASQGGNNLDVLQIRAMMQNQYTNMGGVESLWAIHTVRRALNGLAAPRFYQVPVTGGTVGANMTQAATFDPDAANVINRFMPSLALDRAGNMAFGYSTSSSTTKPAIKYAGRLATDPINTFSQTEQVLIQGAGTQVGNCGGSPCIRWGDYSAMSLDPDGCTFWYTNMYYPVDGLNHHTRIGSFRLPQCTTIGSGSVQGNVTSSSGGGPVSGATVALGSRTTTTDAAGFYSFPNLPAGTYPSITASFPGYTSSTVSSVVVNEGSVTVQNFILNPGANNGCLTDTSQADFQAGVPTNVDLTTAPGDVTLFKPSLDQQNTTLGNSGFGVTTTQWIGQTFMPAVSGTLTKIDLSMFCAGCSGVNPAVTIDIRATSGGLPTGTVLASTTVPGFSSGAAVYYTANFSSPPALTAGTSYAIMARLTTPRTTGNYDATFSAANPYSRGALVFTTNGGVSFSTIAGDDLGFRTYMNSGFTPSGNLISGRKDANPHAGGAVTWTTLSWNAATPAGTSVKFQVAASNSAGGPFNFVGPDGTNATFFTTSGASLAQFNGFRYLEYRALLATTNSSVTPTLNDVSVCFDNTVPTTLAVNSATGTHGGTVNLSATLTDGVSPLGSKTVAFSLNGNSLGSAVTDGSGVASLSNVSLGAINAGTYPTGVGASFARDGDYLGSTATNSLTVNKADASINVTGYSVTYDGNAHTATGTATGVNGESLAGLNLSSTTHTNAGTYAGDAWTFTDVTGNYNNASGTVDDQIARANANINVNGYTGVYDGNAHGATGSATGVNGENLSGLLNLGASFTNVPGGTAHWTFNAGSSNGNYNEASGDVAITITKAALTVTADDKSKLLGAPNPPFTASYSGFVAGEGPSVLGGTLTFTTPATAASPVGSYPVTPSGLTSTNYQITFVGGTLIVGYNVCVAFDQSKANQSGSTIPVKLQLCNAGGVNQSSASVVVQATNVLQVPTNTPAPLNDAGNANPANNFRFDGGMYIFNLKTTGYASGTYLLGFVVSGDPVPHTVQFSVR